jgi:serine/threonine-protein kinase
MTSVEDPEQRIGSTLRDKWVLEALLGVGGMASVYSAKHKIGRRDAIKILHGKVAASEQLRARFEQEAHAVNAFRHPGVVEVRDVDTTEDGAPFMVMELLEGEALSQRLERPIAEREVLEIGAQVLDVLAAAHARGIIHRDIKPDNLFLTLDGRVKVLDFGIARVRSADRQALTTKAGVTLGTMAYMAPEQARGEDIDGRADVYAVGATMFRALAGRIVHDADSQANLVMRVIAHGAPKLQSVIPNVPPAIAQMIDRSLAFEPEDRYPDAATMLADVRAVLGGNAPPYASTAPPIPERPTESSLFDGGGSTESKAKATVVPRARQKQQHEDTPAVATKVGCPDVPSAAIPSAAHATRVSPAGSPLPPGAVPSDRVVIVPSRNGTQVSMGAAAAPVAGDVQTVYGLAPPPGVQARPPSSPQLLTPYGELSSFVRSSPSILALAIGGGVAFLALVLLVVALVWFRSSSPPPESAEATETSAAPPTAMPAASAKQPAPPSRRSRR